MKAEWNPVSELPPECAMKIIPDDKMWLVTNGDGIFITCVHPCGWNAIPKGVTDEDIKRIFPEVKYWIEIPPIPKI